MSINPTTGEHGLSIIAHNPSTNTETTLKNCGYITCVKENSRPVMENMISDAVRMKYCGMSHSMCTELGGVITTNPTS